MGKATLVLPRAPAIGSKWQHLNGSVYTVIMHVNTLDTPLYPLTVIYESENGKQWARYARDWYSGHMTEIAP